MSAIRVLTRAFCQPLEIYCNTILHQNVKTTNIFPVCRQLLSSNNTHNGLSPVNLLTQLKGLYQEYVQTLQKMVNPSFYFHCRRNLHLPVMCVRCSGSLCVFYQVQKFLKNGMFQAFCSEFDTSNHVSKYRPVPLHKNNIFMFVVNIIVILYRIFRLCFRALRLFLTFYPVLFLYPFTLLSHSFRDVWWDIFLFAVEISGPAFIKLGQWASTRRDLFPDEFCDKFSILHHHARSHSWRHTVKKMQQAYGKNWRDIFVIFENNAEPVGSGCVAQVYKAYIREDRLPQGFQDKLLQDRLLEEDLEDQTSYAEGIEMLSWEEENEDENSIFDDEDNLFIPSQPKSSDIPDNIDVDNLIPVAVKVLHPNVHAIFNRDLALMRFMSRVLQLIVPSLRWVSLVECVDEFSISMRKQMNLINEAKCLEKFSKHFSQNVSIRIPRPIWPLVRRDVLVETFEEGEPISKFLKEDESHPAGLREKLAELGVEALIQMVFVNNFVHGDLHPGNILVQGFEAFSEKAEKKLFLVDVFDTMVSTFVKAPSPVRLVFLDCGITASLSSEDLQKFTEVFTAVVKGEGETVAKLFLRKTSVMHCKDEKQFIKDMAAIVNKARGASINLSQIDVAKLLSEVFGVLAKHHVKMESNFATVILAIGVLEGLGRSLDPNIDILEKAKPVLLHEVIF